jgi:hypothetical protein
MDVEKTRPYEINHFLRYVLLRCRIEYLCADQFRV